MTDDQKTAYIIAQAACCNAKLVAMQMQREADIAAGRKPTYEIDDFEDLPVRFGLAHNQVLEFLRS